jgi:hypothetical protein
VALCWRIQSGRIALKASCLESGPRALGGGDVLGVDPSMGVAREGLIGD